LTDTTLSLPSLLGLLLLIGIVVSVGYSLLEGTRQKKRKYAK
jgi:multidrug efflux pump subunit AcrB